MCAKAQDGCSTQWSKNYPLGLSSSFSGRAFSVRGKDMSEIFGWIGTVLFTICYIPQIAKTYRTKDVKDVSLNMWLIQWVAYASCWIYAYSIKAYPMLTGYSLGWLMTAWWLELYRQYHKIPEANKIGFRG